MPTASVSERRAWYMYDWANSAFSTTVVTLFLGPYLTAIAKSAAAPDGFLHIFGIALEPRAYWSFLVSLSVITQVLVMPPTTASASGTTYGPPPTEATTTT